MTNRKQRQLPRRSSAQTRNRPGPVAHAAKWCWEKGTSPDPGDRRTLAWIAILAALVLGGIGVFLFRSARSLRPQAPYVMDVTAGPIRR